MSDDANDISLVVTKDIKELDKKKDNTDKDVEAGTKLLEEQLKDLQQDRELRKEYAEKIFSFICAWSLFIAFIVFLSGSNVIYLSNSVLMTILGTTFLKILGLFYFVMAYLFPNGNNKKYKYSS